MGFWKLKGVMSTCLYANCINFMALLIVYSIYISYFLKRYKFSIIRLDLSPFSFAFTFVKIATLLKSIQSCTCMWVWEVQIDFQWNFFQLLTNWQIIMSWLPEAHTELSCKDYNSNYLNTGCKDSIALDNGNFHIVDIDRASFRWHLREAMDYNWCVCLVN